MMRCGVAGSNSPELASFRPQTLPSVLDAGGLHAEADAEVRDLVLAGVADGVEHALDAALAEASGDEDAVEAFELGVEVVVAAAVFAAGFEALGFDPGDLELEVVGEGSVDEGFLEALVGVFVLDVLADDGDRDLVLRVVGAVDDVLPLGEVRVVGLDAEVLEARASTPCSARLRGTS